MTVINFEKISNINIDDELSWKSNVFLTLDIDWAHDEVLNYTIDLIEAFNVKATWYVTHETPVLNRLRENKNFELGIHPNFNFLLQGDLSTGKNAEEVVSRILEIVPEASSVRSHSMTQSSVLQEVFVKYGLTHEVNHFIPNWSGIDLRPWLLWNGLVKVPYSWEDDIDVIYNEKYEKGRTLNFSEGINVFDFHPIHVFLNTEKISRYEKTRDLHRTPDSLSLESYNGFGTRSNLLKLLSNSENI
jgi:hypothetical protein